MKYRISFTFGLPIMVLSALLFTSGEAGASYSSRIPNPGSKTQDPAALPTIPAGDWPMYGRDYSRTNYNPDETSINAGNVAQLISRWQVNVGTNGTPPSGAPSVSNSKVYVGSSAAVGSDFFAFDANTGSQAWATSLN